MIGFTRVVSSLGSINLLSYCYINIILVNGDLNSWATYDIIFDLLWLIDLSNSIWLNIVTSLIYIIIKDKLGRPEASL